ncbi:EamA family transporter [Pseudomonas sp. FSL L8-0168]|uniref:EamA family transporter n=1 Tax=Pseudomonas sp. FSL L8-0168 TaxID=2921518 RepID=UPI0030D6F4CC
MVATALVLVAALLHATWNALIKFSGERLLVIACMDSVALLFVVLAVGFVSLPPLELWPWLVASALFELLYRYLLIQAYRVGDLGLVYPLMRGLSPLVVLVRKRAAFSLFWRTQWRLGLSVGLCVLLSYALVLWAMQLGSIAEAAALREVSVILVVLFGMRYLKEPFGRPRLIACGLVLIGMLVMKL